MKLFSKALVTTFAAAFASLSLSSAALAAADVDAAKALAKQNNCMKCHSVEKEKDGPSFKKTAAKFKGKADGEAKLVEHLMTGPTVKLADGSEEEHKMIKTSPAKDVAQVRNLVQYILEQ